MNPLRTTLVVAGALATLLVAGVAVTAYTDANDWAARVDGIEISERRFLDELAQFRENPTLEQGLGGGSDGTVPSQLAGLWLSRLVQQELVERLADEQGVRPTQQHVQTAESIEIQQFGGEEAWGAFPEWFRDRLVVRDAVFLAVIEEVGGTPTEADLLREYESSQEEFLQACASHILVETREEADAVKAELDAGGDFAVVATERSIDEGSAARGGDLGCQRRESYVEPFDSQVFTLPLNTVSDPIETQFGFHIAKVAAREVTPFEEVRPELAQRALAAAQERFARVLLERIEGADVQVNPKYGRFEVDVQGPRVVAPEPPAPPDRLPVGGGSEEAPPPGIFPTGP